MAKKLKWNLILMSLLYLALGIFLLMVPGTALNVVCYALGGVVLACAAVQLVRYFVVERGVFQSQLTLISGLVCLALGAFLIIRSDIVVRVLPIVFGLFIIFDSLGRVQNALELRRCAYSSWKVFLLLAVLSVILGIVMVVDPFGTMETLVMAIGIILIIEGAINLLSALYTVLALRRFAKLHPETQSMLEDLTGEDLNGDGKVVVQVDSYTVDFDAANENTDAYYQMAGVTRLSAELSSGGKTYIFLLEDPEGFEAQTGALQYLDGTVPDDPETTDADWREMVYRWTDCPVLTGLDLGGYEGLTLMDDVTGTNQSVLAHLYVGRRGVWDEKQVPTYEGCAELWDTLTAGAVSTAAE